MTAAKTTAIPGILTDNFDILHPDKLSRASLESWYDEHIYDVLSTSGFTSAYYYEFLDDGSRPKRDLQYYTVFHMPDIDFINSPELSALDTLSLGSNKDTIFANSEFNVRTYEVSVPTIQVQKLKRKVSFI